MEVAVDRTGVRVDEQLGGIEAQAVPRAPGAVGPQAVCRAHLDARQEAVVHAFGSCLERHPDLVVTVEQTGFDQLG